jgi:hypothetical protein
MTTTATLFAELNARRIAADMKPLKTWKASTAALEAAVAKLTPVPTATEQGETITVAAVARELGINPKVARAKCRRHAEKLSVDYTNDGWVFVASRKAELVAFLRG